MSKEIEEQERSYKSWASVGRIETGEAKLRHRLTQVKKEKESLLEAIENGTAHGVADVDLIKPVIKRESS